MMDLAVLVMLVRVGQCMTALADLPTTDQAVLLMMDRVGLPTMDLVVPATMALEVQLTMGRVAPATMAPVEQEETALPSASDYPA